MDFVLRKNRSFVPLIKNSRTRFSDSMMFDINGKKVYVTPPPASGVLIGFILNILKGFKFNKASMQSLDDKILTHHRIIEAYKFAYGKRTEIGDTEFNNLDEVVENCGCLIIPLC